ncbi:MAG: DNA gyrase subunit A [Spirochaetota bacterium]
MSTKEKIIQAFIEDEMKNSYLTYAMSVIVRRALPDARDGLKPVHRRILYGMNELGLTHDRPYKKSARVVGDVLGKYHPHGDQAVYAALVRMAQDFSMRYPLVQGQGNFGSIDGDDAAAMRYTEARMMPLAELMLADIEKNTVDFEPNFDDTMKEPSVLPGAFPNLLVNGSAGIAVGMATSIPPHNLGEAINAVTAVIDDPSTSVEKLIGIMPGPDFPTGGLIIGDSGIKEAYEKGNGQIRLRARVSIERMKNGKDVLIVNEIPYQVNKSRLIQDIADQVKNRKIDGITDLRDESDRDGIRIVMEVKRGLNPRVVMNQLFKMTSLEITYGINMLALDKLKPRVMNIKQVIEKYVAHREEIVRRRTKHDLEKAEQRAHILEGFLKALDNIDEIIGIIRASRTPKEASGKLIERFSFTRVQADAILEMRLSRLTGLEREKVKKEYEEVKKLIAELKEIIKSRKNIRKQVVKEIKEVAKKFGDERRTEIISEEDKVDLKDLIVEEDVVVTISHNGFIKRTPITAFRHQARGGTGVTTSSLREDDFIEQMFVASTHDTMLFISNRGIAYSVKVYEVINAGKNSKGQSIKLLLSLREDEYINSFVALRGNEKEEYILFVTKNGYVKKVSIDEFQNIRKTGIIAVRLDGNDSLISSLVTYGKDEILIATAQGYSLRLKESRIRPMGRNARGVAGIRLKEGDRVCGVTRVTDDNDLFMVTENGFGKRVKYSNFTPHGRGTKGQRYTQLNKKTGNVAGVMSITKNDEFVIITARGMIIKLKAKSVSTMGKSAAGVKVVNVKAPDSVAAVARVVQD